jgi:hypothetical protein
MSMLKTIIADVTEVNNGTPQKLNVSPFMGGQGRKAILTVTDLPITSTVLLQGHPVTADGAVPGDASTDWATIVTLTSTSPKVQEVELPLWVRYRTSVLDADGPDVRLNLEGVQ